MGIAKKLSKKRITALLTVLIILLQMFSPYGVLINISKALNADTDKVVLVKASVYNDWCGKKEVAGKAVNGITISKDPTDLTYNNGDILDFSGGKVTISYDDDTEEELNITDAISSKKIEVDSKYASDTKRKATFTAKGTNIKTEMPYYTLSNVTKKTDPSKIIYNYGDTIDFTGGKLNLEYTDCNTQKVTEELSIPLGITANIITIDKTTADATDPKVTVTYKDYDVDIALTVNDITVNFGTTSFEYGTTKARVKIQREEVKLLNARGITAPLLNSNEESINQPITVSNIQIIPPTKTEYKYGESLDLTGGEIIPINGSEAQPGVPMTTDEITGYNPNQLGEQTITVEYEGQTESFKVTVKDYVQSVTINPNSINGGYGDTLDDILDKNTLYYTVRYAVVGNQAPVQITKDMITNASTYDSESTSAQNMKISYRDTKDDSITSGQDFEANFTVTLLEGIKKVTLLTLPTKTKYKYGEDIDLAGGSIEIEKNSGAKEIKALEPSMISGYNANILGDQTIIVTYKDITVTFEITVEDTIISVELMTPPDKTTYEYGEELDLTGAILSITRASGNTEMQVTYDMISEYDEYYPGLQMITVTYEGFTDTFIVHIKEEVKEEPIPEPEPTLEPEPEPEPNYDSATTLEPEPNYDLTPVREKRQTNFTGFNTEPTRTVITKEKEERPYTPIEGQRPAKTLGVKDKKDNSLIPIAFGISGLIALIILASFKRNVKVFAKEKSRYKLAESIRISKKNLVIDADKYFEKDEYPKCIKIRLSKKISKKLDGKEIAIKYKDNYVRTIVKYKGEPFKAILE